MTAPVVTRVIPGQGPFCKSLFSIHFFVPFAYQAQIQHYSSNLYLKPLIPHRCNAESHSAVCTQDNPPAPSNKDVHIESANSEIFAVSQFGGFLVDDYTLSQKAQALQAALESDGVKFENDSFFTAGYDPPYRCSHLLPTWTQ